MYTWLGSELQCLNDLYPRGASEAFLTLTQWGGIFVLAEDEEEEEGADGLKVTCWLKGVDSHSAIELSIDTLSTRSQ